ncbi:MAG: helix-turn-helix domain-containing protein [Clostridiales bacterium]|nr:helix-turn-helix domain-containing protein [Clostridiales bacterium]
MIFPNFEEGETVHEEDGCLERLKLVRKQTGLSQSSFAKKLGLRQSTISAIERGVRPLSQRYAKIICSTFDINEHWLYTGDGEMLIPDADQFLEVYRCLAPASQKFLLTVAQELLKTEQELLSPEEEGRP